MTPGDKAVRWIERAFYFMVFASIVWQLWYMPEIIRDTKMAPADPSIFLPPYVLAVTGWIYAMATRTRKPPKDTKT